MTRLTRFLIALTLAAVAPALGLAQQGGPYAPRLIVNDRAITNWEVDQRIRMMVALNSPGDLETEALEGLVEDRLRMDAARAMGLEVTPEAVDAGMEEFAARGGLSAEQFAGFLAQNGVATESFRDFVEAGLAWRQVVQTRFGPRAQITEQEIDRAIALTTRAGSARILMSEIILRADTPEYKAQAQELSQQLARNIDSDVEFAAAARQYSVSQSAGRGGRVDWLDLSRLPPAIAAQVLSLGPGEVTDPIPLNNAIGLFQLRAIEEEDPREPETLAVEYARLLLPEGATQRAADLALEVDVCDDLYGIALDEKLPPEQLLREAQSVADVPGDLATQLAGMDDGETTILARNGATELLMLCGRTPALDQEFDRGALRQRLVSQRMGSYADSYLAELRADAIIREP
ncbi:peptidylprolyl isomerase [Actibacterium sp. XHP0104]|uniref:peptidylprolyl isomerase n=1 Tax=Actibacterium sp. XHP0104 TaxID=2984335 RepID=UPI0021E9A42F|nr:peptidylprolyl isomerase [Actibacterium sp. XHP0104]MCV2880795.1 peptidylprolyl isomerase [Actibacterium sp. XHP0104]